MLIRSTTPTVLQLTINVDIALVWTNKHTNTLEDQKGTKGQREGRRKGGQANKRGGGEQTRRVCISVCLPEANWGLSIIRYKTTG